MSNVIHLSAHALDHLPILLHVKSFVLQRCERSFKFEKSWLFMDDCEATVKDAWDDEVAVEQGLAATLKKVQATGSVLMQWGVARTTLDEEAIKQIQKRLDRINEKEMTAVSKAKYLELNKKMDELLQK